MRRLRLVIIWCIAAGLLLAAYFIYNRIAGTHAVYVRPEAGGNIEVPKFTDDSARIGDTAVGPSSVARFIDYDENKNIRRVFGYEKLLNPEKGSKVWELQKPYMYIYDKNTTCHILSEHGTVEVEMLSGSPKPRNARLSGNVEIQVLSDKPGASGPIKIFLDDLVYSSERSEFTTEGAVKLLSTKAELQGKGMQLIYNAQADHLEYLKVADLHRLFIKDVTEKAGVKAAAAENAVPGGAMPADAAGAAADAPVAPVADLSESGKTSVVAAGPAAAVSQANAAAETSVSGSRDFYECRFFEDVVIEYGNQMIISGADEVLISNILLKQSQPDRTEPSRQSDAKAEQSPAQSPQAKPAMAAESVPAQVQAPTNAAQPLSKHVPDAVPAVSDSSVDVTVTCRAGMVIKLIDSVVEPSGKSAPAVLRMVELLGRPVRIEKVMDASGAKTQTIAECGLMKYNLDADVLDMFARSTAEPVCMNMPESDATLQTAGPVKWERKNNRAMVAGPGRLSINPPDTAKAQPSTEMNFKGVMNLFFAENSLPSTPAAFVLQSAKLTGGMDATIRQESTSHAAADTATFLFDVHRSVSRAELAGNVQFATIGQKDNSLATANTAILEFSNSSISTAELDGAVSFESPRGRLDSSWAKVLFATDRDGRTYPVKVNTAGNPVLMPAQTKDAPNSARFAATKIDYDMVTGNALAEGPVEFTFYEKPSTLQQPLAASPVPVIITAQKNAEFLADAAGSINTVVFNGDVLGIRQTEANGITQKSTMTGDKMTVLLGNNADPNNPSVQISQVLLTGRNVKLESIRSSKTEKLSHTKLLCSRLDYDAVKGIVLAPGPGSIEINNRNAPSSDAGRSVAFGLEKPCYANIEGFDELKWFVNSGRLSASGKTKGINIGYVPILEDSSLGTVVNAAVSNIDADFVTAQSGRTELATMTASDGVSYEEKKKGGHVLIGDSLVFDRTASLITISGTKNNPCFVDGARAEVIKYNPTTGKLDTKLTSAPGSFSPPPSKSRR